MFRASSWIPYDPGRRFLPSDTDHNHATRVEPTSTPQVHSFITKHDMDAPEISTLREEEEESSPPPDSALPFAKFRVNARGPSWGQGAAASGSGIGPPVGPAVRMGVSPPDSDEEEEEDQLIDDDELAIVTETGQGPATSSPSSMVSAGNSTPQGSPRKRGGLTRLQPRRPLTGRRGRPGREPPDAAAMMSTFEVGKGDQPVVTPPKVISPAPAVVPNPSPPLAVPSTATTDWAASMPPKPPRKKPGPKKGTTLGPRGPRKTASKTAHNTPGTSTPLVDDSLMDPSTFLVPAPPSIPPTPGPDQLSLPSSSLPPIVPPDFILDPAVPVPVYALPTRAFPVQAPPKVPTGYAPTHTIDPKRGPARKWTIMQREIKGIGGGRWFARAWVAPQTAPQQPVTRPSSPPAPPEAITPVAPPMPMETGPGHASGPASRASSLKPEAGAAQALLELDRVDPVRWPNMVQNLTGIELSSRGPRSPHSRTHSNSPFLGATAEEPS